MAAQIRQLGLSLAAESLAMVAAAGTSGKTFFLRQFNWMLGS